MQEGADPLEPKACQTMEDVRDGVDALDRALVALLRTRQGYMEAAARIKPTETDVRVPWRIEEVVTNVLAEAERTGLSPRIAEPVWRVLVDCCIAHELEQFRALRRGGSD